jgi:hypothetical protein
MRQARSYRIIDQMQSAEAPSPQRTPMPPYSGKRSERLFRQKGEGGVFCESHKRCANLISGGEKKCETMPLPVNLSEWLFT